MTHNLTHPAEHIDATVDALNHVLGRHLGVLIADTEAADVLEHLARTGYELTDTTTNTPWTDTEHLDVATLTTNVQVHVHVSATDTTVDARRAILNAREAAALDLP